VGKFIDPIKEAKTKLLEHLITPVEPAKTKTGNMSMSIGFKNK